MKSKPIAPFLLVCFLLVVSCKEKSEYQNIDQNVSQQTSEDIHKIVVIEYLEAGTYKYVNVKENEETYWIAIPNGFVEIGKTYYFKKSMTAEKFESKQLNKVFDKIVFSEGIFESIEAMNSGKSGGEHGHDHNHDGHAETNHDNHFVASEIKLTPVKNAITIEKLFSGLKSFSKKEALFYGIVVKVNNGILDRNWVHIVDGTKFNTNESLTITTNESVKVGDTIKIKGTVILDKDFGQGYKYDVLIENGKLIK